MFTAEKAFAAEKDKYSTQVGQVGFSPERNNRYAYFANATVVSMETRGAVAPVATATDEGVEYDSFKYGTVAPWAGMNAPIATLPCGGTPGVNATNTDWTGAAKGQIDNDATFDVWSIATATRDYRAAAAATCANGGNTNPGGEPNIETNDVNQ